ncbi:MAG: hypothetical protein KAR42_11020 [candidate division Zixibacteria bacterium]|nr:hypothetical protein [candidate division Zixibacteria bacterium]
MNITIPPGTPVDLMGISGISIGTLVEIVTLQCTVKVFNTVAPPNVVTNDFLPCIYGAQKVVGQANDPGLWGYSANGGLVDIREVT